MTPTAAPSRDRSEPAPGSGPLLAIRDLAISFEGDRGERVTAVDGLSLTIHDGQTLALVGESGCGKSVTALSVLGLLACPPARIDGGSIRASGRELLGLGEADLLAVRGSEIGMIFQEPVSSLNPVLSIGDQLVEAVRRHRRIPRAAARDHAVALLKQVGLPRPDAMLAAYPHELSGGMCQRVMIALALTGGPRLLIADEPTTALDVTIQAQILDLLLALRQRNRMAILLITHDLGVVAQHADVVCVMYAGRVVEYASVRDLFESPAHPYTRGLFSAIPRLGARRPRLRTV
ncbi:MAG: ABC transporter ATP-binding protein, partial [Phycisphaerae bacterium]|nr:ABC transporter ATP-binding protein [Phycisphaerae bacterium]